MLNERNPETGIWSERTVDDTDIFYYFQQRGLHFSDEVISRYVLSLHSKPFVILTGISGTGKTKIAQLFADYICHNYVIANLTEEHNLKEEDRKKLIETKLEAEREQRIAFVPVRPDWLDNRGILGYYNILEQAYSSTPILRLLIEAAKPENQDKPYFIILDEMNLAKVEYYFADFLSIMESRTTGNEDNEKGEKLHLHDGNKEGVVKDADGTVIPKQLHIPDNVYFTGTVNIDESTYMFSPKVLDRANVIEFNEVNLLPANQKATTDSQFRLNNAGIEKIKPIFNKEHRRAFCHSQDFIDCSAKQNISAVHEILKNSNLHFGYRVANEMGRFINLADELVGDQHRTETIDIQILQKILPKFHGTKNKLQDPLKDLQKHCETVGYKRSFDKLQTMLDQLERDGYTSFIQ